MTEARWRVVLVTGSRDWDDEGALFAALDAEAPDLIIHGDCPTGADAMCYRYSAERGLLPLVPMPAQWGRYGNGAGPRRNAAMLRVLLLLRAHGWDVSVVAAPLPQGTGTQDMMSIADDADVRVVEVRRGVRPPN